MIGAPSTPGTTGAAEHSSHMAVAPDLFAASEHNSSGQAPDRGCLTASDCLSSPWRNKKNDMGALMIATIGSRFGAEAVAPYNALYGATAHGIAASDAAPLTEMADALAALMKAHGPKARLDTLPTLKTAAEALNGYILSLEKWRLAA